VLPEVRSHTLPITKGNSPGEGEKKKESDFLSDGEREEKNSFSELNSERPRDRIIKSKFINILNVGRC
jgi:hypothetical protein